MPKIAVSYRRTDTDATGRIYDRLVQRYGKDSIFRDIDRIRLGVDFRKAVNVALNDTDILLAIVGPNWRGAAEDGSIRIDEANDLVRIEVETALKRDIPVIPVLISGSVMPKATELPESLSEFPFRNAATIDSGRNFDHDIEHLMRSMDEIIEEAEKARAEKQAAVLQEQEEAEAKRRAEEEESSKRYEAEARQRAEADKERKQAEQERAKKAAERAEQKQREKEERDRRAQEARDLKARRQADEELKKADKERKQAEQERAKKAAERAEQKQREQEERDRQEQEARDLKAKRKADEERKRREEQQRKAQQPTVEASPTGETEQDISVPLQRFTALHQDTLPYWMIAIIAAAVGLLQQVLTQLNLMFSFVPLGNVYLLSMYRSIYVGAFALLVGKLTQTKNIWKLIKFIVALYALETIWDASGAIFEGNRLMEILYPGLGMMLEWCLVAVLFLSLKDWIMIGIAGAIGVAQGIMFYAIEMFAATPAQDFISGVLTFSITALCIAYGIRRQQSLQRTETV